MTSDCDREIDEYFGEMARSTDSRILLQQMRDGSKGFYTYNHACGAAWKPNRNECIAILRARFGFSYSQLGEMFRLSDVGALFAARKGRKSIMQRFGIGGQDE